MAEEGAPGGKNCTGHGQADGAGSGLESILPGGWKCIYRDRAEWNGPEQRRNKDQG